MTVQRPTDTLLKPIEKLRRRGGSFARSTRNAWQDLFIRRPGDKNFKIAYPLRDELIAAVEDGCCNSGRYVHGCPGRSPAIACRINGSLARALGPAGSWRITAQHRPWARLGCAGAEEFPLPPRRRRLLTPHSHAVQATGTGIDRCILAFKSTGKIFCKSTVTHRD